LLFVDPRPDTVDVCLQVAGQPPAAQAGREVPEELVIRNMVSRFASSCGIRRTALFFGQRGFPASIP
jgi:hypothetical protein